MSKRTKRANIPLKELPFMNSALPKLFNCGELEALTSDSYRSNAISLSESTNHDVLDLNASRLDGVLKSWNFKHIPVSGDGNCLFYAVAHSLVQRDSSTMTVLVEKLKYTPGITQIELATLLRRATVDEWLGENSHLYQSFLTRDQLQSETYEFLQDGHFSGDLGNIVLPALVNILSRPVRIFTSAENMPVVTLMPLFSFVTDSQPIFLAYNQNGPGHYDAVSHLEQPQEKENIEPILKYTCGRNSTKGVSCIYSMYHYITKCPCFKVGRSCSYSCICKGCQNPHGARPQGLTFKKSLSRKRDRYETQAYPLQGRKTSKVMQQVSEDVSTESMSNFEYLLISAMIQYDSQDVEDWTDVNLIDPDFISYNFDSVRNIATSLDMQLPLYKRSEQEIENAIKHYRFQYDVFYKVHT